MQKIQESREIAINAEQAASIVASENYLKQVYAGQSAENPRIVVDQDDEHAFVARVIRDVRIREKAPGFAKGLVKEVMEVVHRHEWQRGQSPATGRFIAEFSGMPGSLEADMQLHALDEKHMRFDMDGRVKVSIPLLGGKLEKYLVGVVSDKFQDFLNETAKELESRAA